MKLRNSKDERRLRHKERYSQKYTHTQKGGRARAHTQTLGLCETKLDITKVTHERKNENVFKTSPKPSRLRWEFEKKNEFNFPINAK